MVSTFASGIPLRCLCCCVDVLLNWLPARELEAMAATNPVIEFQVRCTAIKTMLASVHPSAANVRTQLDMLHRTLDNAAADCDGLRKLITHMDELTERVVAIGLSADELERLLSKIVPLSVQQQSQRHHGRCKTTRMASNTFQNQNGRR